MDYLVIMEIGNISQSMCQCVGPGVTLCGDYCGYRCEKVCGVYCNDFCAIRYCSSNIRVTPYNG